MNGAQTNILCYFSNWHKMLQVLLIFEHQQTSIAHCIWVQYLFAEFLSRIFCALTVIAVDYKYQSIGTFVLVAPDRSNLISATNIPNNETDMFVLDNFDIESNGWNC